MSYYRLQARAPEPKKKKTAPRFAPPCVRNPLWQGLSAALAIVSLYQIHYSKFPEYRGFDTPTIPPGLGGASWGVQTCFLHPLRLSGLNRRKHISGTKDIQNDLISTLFFGEGVQEHRSCTVQPQLVTVYNRLHGNYASKAPLARSFSTAVTAK